MTKAEIQAALDGATKWPWGIEQTSERFWIGPMREDRKKIADLVVSLDTGEDYSDAYNSRQNANARLIAMAPDLARRVLELETRLIATAAHLAAAISLLEKGGKEAAPSDKMFDQMLEDYRGSVDAARAALKETRDD